MVPAAGWEGERLGSFQVHELLGSGAMGEVYRARDLRLGREVAIKLLPERLSGAEGLLARFEREARLLAALNHPHIATLHELAQDNGTRFLVMEMVSGETLARRLEGGPLPVPDVLRLFVQLADAIGHAHENGVIHRDLKPANIKITDDGQVKVLDFGLAKALSAVADPDAPTLAPGESETLHTVEGAVVGTVPYMSPEQALGQSVDKRSDIWAFGCLFYQCLAGRLPFPGATAADVIAKILSATPDWTALPEEVPEKVRTLIRRCLEREAQDRLQDISDAHGAIQEALAAAASGVGESAGPEGFRAILVTRVTPELRQRLGPAPAAAALGLHDELFGRCLERWHGFREEHERDGFVATFALPSQALHCALDFQQGLSELELIGPLSVGMVVHIGEIVREDSDGENLGGLAMETAARVLGLAEAGHVLLTDVAFDAGRQQVLTAADGSPLEWLAHGPYLFEGLESPLPVFEVGVAGPSLLRPPQDTEAARRAVVPGDDETLGWRPARGLTVPGRAHWLLEERLGEGGFGEVWRASHEKTKAKRAFKFCFDPQRVRGLQREVVLFRLLKETLGERDDIAQILDWQFDEAPYFLEVEHTEGGDLAQWAASQGGLAEVPLETRLELAAQIATALAAAHGVGVLHKDVKPANILINENPETGEPHAVLTDFGIGLVTDQGALADSGVTVAGFTKTLISSSSGSGTGTPLYMAPEVLEGRPATIQSDIYSLGVVLYQLVVGDFSRVVAPGWERGVEDELLREDIAACVDGDPERRLAGGVDLVRRLRNLNERQAERESEARAREEAVRAKRRRRALAMTSMAGLALSVLIALVAWRESVQRRAAEQIQYVASVQFAGAALEQKKNVLARESLRRTPERLRGWEWEHLVDRAWPPEVRQGEPAPVEPGATAADLWDGADVVVLAKRQEAPHSLTIGFDPSGEHLVIAAGQVVKIWHLETETIIFEREFPTRVGSAVMSPDEALLALTLQDHTAEVWDVDSGRRRHVLRGHTEGVGSVWFTPDGALVLTGSRDRTLRVWDAATGEHLRTLLETTEGPPVLDVAFLDGARAMLPSRNQQVRVWNLLTGDVEGVIQGPVNPELVPVAITPRGTHVLSVSPKEPWNFGTSLMWSTESGKALYAPPVLQGEHGAAWGSFSPDGSAMAVEYDDGTIHLFEIETGRELTTLAGLFEDGRRLAWSPDGSRLAFAQQDGMVFLLAPAASPWVPDDQLVGQSDWVVDAVWSPDSTRLASVSLDGSVVIWDVAARRQVIALPHPEPPYGAEFSPSGRWLWTWTFPRHRVWNTETFGLEFEKTTGMPFRTDPRDPFVVYALNRGSDHHFSPDGARIVLPFSEEARVLATESGETLLALPGKHRHDGLEYGPHGARIFTVSEDDLSITVWDATSGERLHVLEAASSLNRVEVSSDGSLVAAGSLHGVLHVWDVDSGSEVHAIQADDTDLFATFDSDGERVLTQAHGGTAKLWSMTNGELLAMIEGPPGAFVSAGISPDGTRVLRGNGELFDLEGNLLLTLEPYGNQRSWSPDGRTIAAALYDGTVRLWDTSPWPELRDLGGSSLDLEERVQRWRAQQHKRRTDSP